MGVQCSSTSQAFQKQWNIIEITPNVYVLKHSSRQIEVEKHIVPCKPNVFHNEQGILEWRKANRGKSNILQIYMYQLVNNNNSIKLCEGAQFFTLELYTEKLIRISKIPILNKLESLQLLADLVNASMSLVQKFGFFKINQKMLGINADKIGKMWISSNFAKNHIENRMPVLQRINSEQQMVTDLLNILQNKVCFVKQLKGKNFFESLNFIALAKQQLNNFERQSKNANKSKVSSLASLLHLPSKKDHSKSALNVKMTDKKRRGSDMQKRRQHKHSFKEVENTITDPAEKDQKFVATCEDEKFRQNSKTSLMSTNPSKLTSRSPKSLINKENKFEGSPKHQSNTRISLKRTEPICPPTLRHLKMSRQDFNEGLQSHLYQSKDKIPIVSSIIFTATDEDLDQEQQNAILQESVIVRGLNESQLDKNQ